MPKICELTGVRASGEDAPWLWRDEATGRLMLRVFAESGCTYTDVDFWDLVDWLRSGPGKELLPTDGAGTSST